MIPGILDHDMVAIDIELKAHYNKPKRRATFRNKNASWRYIKSNGEKIIQNEQSVEEKWQEFKSTLMKH